MEHFRGRSSRRSDPDRQPDRRLDTVPDPQPRREATSMNQPDIWKPLPGIPSDKPYTKDGKPALYLLPHEHKYLLCNALYSKSLTLYRIYECRLDKHPRFTIPTDRKGAEDLLLYAEDEERRIVSALPPELKGSHALDESQTADIKTATKKLKTRLAQWASSIFSGSRKLSSSSGRVTASKNIRNSIHQALDHVRQRQLDSEEFSATQSTKGINIPRKDKSSLCAIHYPMSTRMLRAIIRLIKKEVDHIDSYLFEIPSFKSRDATVSIRGRSDTLDKLHSDIKAIQAYWTPHNSHKAEVQVNNICDGCIISAIVSVDENLINLRTAARLRKILSGTKNKPSNKHAELVTWLEFWMQTAVETLFEITGEPQERDNLVIASEKLFHEIMSIRKTESASRYASVFKGKQLPPALQGARFEMGGALEFVTNNEQQIPSLPRSYGDSISYDSDLEDSDEDKEDRKAARRNDNKLYDYLLNDVKSSPPSPIHSAARPAPNKATKDNDSQVKLTKSSPPVQLVTAPTKLTDQKTSSEAKLNREGIFNLFFDDTKAKGINTMKNDDLPDIQPLKFSPKKTPAPAPFSTMTEPIPRPEAKSLPKYPVPSKSSHPTNSARDALPRAPTVASSGLHLEGGQEQMVLLSLATPERLPLESRLPLPTRPGNNIQIQSRTRGDDGRKVGKGGNDVKGKGGAN